MKGGIKLSKKIKIGKRTIAEDQPVFVVAEIGSVHDGNFNLAKCLVETAKDAGADAVKFQIHIPEAETLRDAPMPPFFKGEPRFEYFKRTGFSEQEWRKLKKYTESMGLVFSASSFSIDATELLERLGVLFHKVPSGEVTNIPYLEHMAATGKPIFLSSGMSSFKELDEAVDVIAAVNPELVVLQCTTEYPVLPERVGLNLIREIKDRYGVLSGFSDHSADNYSAFVSVSLGARVIEKHIALSKKMYGSDARNALTPEEFKELVNGVRVLENVLINPVDKDNIKAFKEMKLVFQKSIVASSDIPKGTVLELRHLSFKKPGDGVSASDYKNMIGKMLLKNKYKDEKILHADIK